MTAPARRHRIRTPGMATPEQIADLHQLLAKVLNHRLTEGNAPVAVLSVARQFLKAYHVGPTDRDIRRLERLHRVYLGQLLKGLEADPVTTAHLSECRLFLVANGVTRSDAAQGTYSPEEAKELLTNLPFPSDQRSH